MTSKTGFGIGSLDLDPELVAKMTAAQRMTAEPCPECGAGRGKFCIFDVTNRDGSPITDRVHRTRPR